MRLVIVALSSCALAACTPDTFESSDASQSDAQSDASASADSFCSGQGGSIVYCNDFDEPSNAALGFNLVRIYDGGGTLALSSTAMSPPSSLQATASPRSSTTELYTGAAGVENVGSRSAMTCDFDWRATQGFGSDPLDTAAIVVIAMSAGETTGLFSVIVGPLGTVIPAAEVTSMPVVVDAGSTIYAPLTQNVDVGDWFHFTVDLDLVVGTWTVTLKGSVAAVNTIPSMAKSSTPVPMSLNIGAADFQSKEPSVGWSFLYDNVICR
jgi:hypothetical protein